jgi:predicted acyl esterase
MVLGCSEAVYDGNERRSEYLTLSNGMRLAYDLYLPTKKGIPADKPLPALFKYTPYTRAFTIFDKDGQNIIADLFNLGWKERYGSLLTEAYMKRSSRRR